MGASRPEPWLRLALLIGFVYFLIGRLFAAPATHIQAWRLAAWAVCALVFATHICYERLRQFHSVRLVALHAATAVAIGAFLLAVAGMFHSLVTTSTIRPVWLLALILWPAFTAVPAFLVAFVIAFALAHIQPRADPE
jgi:hypothetical protein